MGIFDGLTDEEARALDPLAMARLEAWRQGRTSVENIGIPKAESVAEFLERVQAGLKAVEAGSLNPVVIITRSLGIAIVNIMTGYMSGRHKEYLRYRFDPGGITRMTVDSGNWKIAVDNDSSYLAGLRAFKDD